MTTQELIIARQVAWAKSKGVGLVGSKGTRGARVYMPTLEDSFFVPMSDSTLEQFRQNAPQPRRCRAFAGSASRKDFRRSLV